VQDDKDWAKSLEAHRKYLQRYALFHLHDAALAEDAVQDTLIAALAQSHRFEGRSQLRTWLTAILKHKIVDLVLTGTFLTAKYTAQHMLMRKSGSIVLTATVDALIGQAGLDAYTAAKGGVVAMTRSMAAGLRGPRSSGRRPG